MATIAEKIIASLPKKLSGPKAQAALVRIISALSGERVHFYDSWHVSGGWKTLRSADGADDAFRALRSAGVPVVTGNDAPRGGRTGEYFEARRNLRIAAQVMEIHGELYASVRGYPCSLYDEWGREKGSKWGD